jgi:hypothetical protein
MFERTVRRGAEFRRRARDVAEFWQKEVGGAGFQDDPAAACALRGRPDADDGYFLAGIVQ